MQPCLTQLSHGLSGIGFQVGGWVGTPYPYHVCDSPQLSGVEWELSKPSDLIISRGKSSQATTYSLSSESLRKQLTQSWPSPLHCPIALQLHPPRGKSPEISIILVNKNLATKQN